MLNLLNSYYVNFFFYFICGVFNYFFYMKIRVFPSHNDEYNSIIIDTDELSVVTNTFYSDGLPSVYVSDIIEDLISQN